MRYEIRRRGVEVTEGLRAHVAERLRIALTRFAGYVGEVRVYLRDVNGPRGGLDKQCRIVVEMPRYGRVVVIGADTDLHVAITRTTGRAGFAVRRRVKRRLARRRPGRRAAPVPAGAPGETDEVWRRQRAGAVEAAE
jgi:ribosome-associated translation inhibitor RaiA